ncbi:unnamed protein product [Vitrella brassicaformis CCMP3155]|uniref:IPT/TIG domain-containing protein n=1 Tax=Vitrella brassicaformis (strain CCMP3155) TaxID=1169540 RepID=A0A0G4FRM4_VITBC|nr:unnamed protein product [Vitrella brassicaformis CCMP3155]|eukprot:CEM17315.1 unnamed protein product [Vitrella brassicaformis CCMP3155]
MIRVFFNATLPFEGSISFGSLEPLSPTADTTQSPATSRDSHTDDSSPSAASSSRPSAPLPGLPLLVRPTCTFKQCRQLVKLKLKEYGTLWRGRNAAQTGSSDDDDTEESGASSSSSSGRLHGGRRFNRSLSERLPDDENADLARRGSGAVGVRGLEGMEESHAWVLQQINDGKADFTFVVCGRALSVEDEESVRLSDHSLGDGSILNCVVQLKWTDTQVELQPVPAQCLTEGGRVINVFGDYFVNSRYLSCRFGRIVVPATFQSRHQIRCIAPPHPAGVVSLQVSVDGGHTFLEPGTLFCYVDPMSSSRAVRVRCQEAATSQLQSWGAHYGVQRYERYDDDRNDPGGSGGGGGVA